MRRLLLLVATLGVLAACAPPPISKVPDPQPDHGAGPRSELTVKLILRPYDYNERPANRRIIGKVSSRQLDGKPATMIDDDTGETVPFMLPYSERGTTHQLNLTFTAGVADLTVDLVMQGYGGDYVTIELTDAAGVRTIPYVGPFEVSTKSLHPEEASAAVIHVEIPYPI